MCDVIAQVVDQIGIWVVCDNDLSSVVDSTYQTRKSGSCTQFKDSLSFDYIICVFFEVERDGAPSVPEMMSLTRSALHLTFTIPQATRWTDRETDVSAA